MALDKLEYTPLEIAIFCIASEATCFELSDKVLNNRIVTSTPTIAKSV